VIRLPSSLRWRLILANASLLTACLFSFSLLLYAAFGRALSRHFDERLAADAATIAHMVEEHRDGSWEFEGQNEFERMFGGAYFEVHLDDRQLFARSRSLNHLALRSGPWSVKPALRAVVLPDGAQGRVYLAALLPRPDDELAKPTGRKIWVSVARTTSELDSTMATLRLLLWGSGLTALAVASIVCVLAIGRGLKPLRRLLSRVDRIDAHRLGDRLPVDDLPLELQPVASKLNELLSRIEISFAREREWNTAVSHELRTPLAGLRAILDVTASRERTTGEYRGAIEDARQVVTQMNQLVDQLLLLARLDAHAWEVTRDQVCLHQLVEDCFAALRAKANTRKLRFDNRVPVDLVLTSDHDKLRIVIGNLISNAVEYSSTAGEIRVESDVSQGCMLRVCNSGPAIPEAALSNIFEPFVRLESARSGNGEHCGIGLTLVRALCEALALSISAENRADGWVVFRIGTGQLEVVSSGRSAVRTAVAS
jgi:signal transduction histidine kinase